MDHSISNNDSIKTDTESEREPAVAAAAAAVTSFAAEMMIIMTQRGGWD